MLLGLMMVLLSCHQEMQEQMPLQISLCIPIQSTSSDIRHAPGDPGNHEVLVSPRYVYLFVMKDNGDGTWGVWRRQEMTLNENDWIATRYAGSWMTRGDSIYKYKKPIQFLLGNDTPQGRVYAVCSNKQLTFNTAFNSVSNLTQLLNWKFDSSPDSIQENLQNIYSTPYNYKNASDQYYCTFDCTSGHSFNIDLILYHVAAKVDITWHVAENKRTDPATLVRLTQMDALELFNGNAYCFRPMRNELAEKQADGYDRENIVKSDDVGLWWEGRTYFYTIPYIVTGTTVDGKNYFPLQMKMETNGSGEYYTPTLNLKIDTSAVFVPWLRANFNINAALSADSPTLTVDE